MGQKESFRRWIEEEEAKAQKEIQGLPFDPTPEALAAYERLRKKLLGLARLKATHFPPEYNPDPKLKEALYD